MLRKALVSFGKVRDNLVMTPATDDQSLNMESNIRRAQQGDAAAVAELYRAFASEIYRYVTYRVSNPADVEDITAEVFLKMVEGLPRYRITGAPFEAWLYRIAAARIVDYRRRVTRRAEQAITEQLANGTALPEERLQQQDEVRVLGQALRQLSDEHQTILLLRFVEGKTHQEVAAILNKSMTAVKTAQYRALIHLTELLGSNEKVRHYLRGRDD